MKKIILLIALVVVLSFFSYQKANALSITALPQQEEFGPNDWIKVNLGIHEYNGGPVKWIAHRPDNSTISGTVDVINQGNAVHQIVRDAWDNEFGPWSINYVYGDVNQTIHFKVNPLNLRVVTDKDLYYEPDMMNINITTAYYNPNAGLAQFYHLRFYDKDGNLATVRDIDIRVLQPSILYNFPVGDLARYNPPGLYKLKIQYYNSIFEIPFLLGDIHKLMEISADTSATYYRGDNVILDLIFTSVKESTGILKITDPLGNTTSHQFLVDSVHTVLTLNDTSEKIGNYTFEIQYSGIKKTGVFMVVANKNQLPKIELEVYLNKMNFRRGEMVEAKVHTSDVIANSISSWVTDPNGTQLSQISIPVSSNDVIVPHRISKTDAVGMWNLYVNYGGVIRSSSFYVNGELLEDNELLNSGKFVMPAFLSDINSTLNSPSSITIDSDNSYYIADSGSSQIIKFDSKGNMLFLWGKFGSSNGEFRHPTGVFVNQNYVYVADTGNARIQMFDKLGNFIYSWGTYGNDKGMFHTPVSINADESGNLFVVDSGLNTIQIFDIHGAFQDEIPPVYTVNENFTGIKTITFDSNYNFYIVTTDNKILKYTSVGKFVNYYGSSGVEEGRFNNPSGAVIDSKGYLYVADTGNHRIQKFDPNGNFVLSWGTEGSTSGQFEEPTGLAVDSADNIYIVDKKNNDIQKFALYGGTINNIPTWVRNTTVWWSDGALDKTDFSLAIKYLANQGLIHTPPETGHNSIAEPDFVKIPEWVKKTAGWWTSGQIDGKTFFMSIQHLISTGIMKI